MENVEKNSFINSMVQLRNKKHITQQKLSAMSGVNQPVIARLEKGKSDPQLSTILKLLKCLEAELIIKEEHQMDYFITLEKEVMSEVAASIEATIINYMVKHNINGETTSDPIVVLLHNVHRIKDSLIGKEYNMDELKLIQAKFEFARDYINEVINANE